MGDISDDKKALELLALGKVPDEIKPRVMQKLGVEDDDIKAWSLAKTLPDDQANIVKNKIFEKVATNKKIEKPSLFSTINLTRFLAKNFIDQDINTQKKFFNKLGFETKSDMTGALYVYDRSKNKNYAIDQGKDIFDITDIFTDVLEGIGVGAATIAGAKAGTSIGAAIGAPVAPPFGSLIGATVGGIGGGLLGAYAVGSGAEAARQYVAMGADARDYFDSERMNEAGLYASAFAPIDLLGLGISKSGQISKAKSGTAKIEKLNSEKLKEAAKILGVDLTPGQLKASKQVQELEASLVKSTGQIGGSKLRKQIESNKDQIQKVITNLLEPSEELTLFQAGQSFGANIKNTVAERLAPAIEVYKKYDDVFKDVNINDALPPAKKGLYEIAKKRGKKPPGWLIQQMEEPLRQLQRRVEGSPEGIAIAKTVIDRLSNTNTINDITQTRQIFRDNARRYRDDPIWQYVNNNINAVLKNKRNEAILALAKKDPKLGEQAVKELKMADQIYAETAGQIENISGKKKGSLKPGVRTALSDWVDTLDNLGKLQKVIDTKNPTKIFKSAKDFPEEFEILRNGYKTEFYREMSSNISKDGFNVGRIVKSLDKMSPEALAVIYGENAKEIVSALKLYLKSIPDNINPSNTGKFLDLLKSYTLTGYPLVQLNSLWREMKLNSLVQKSTDRNVREFIGDLITKSSKKIRPVAYPIGKKENNNLLPNNQYRGFLPKK